MAIVNLSGSGFHGSWQSWDSESTPVIPRKKSVNLLEGLGVDDVWRRKPPLGRPALSFSKGANLAVSFRVRVDDVSFGWMLVLHCCWIFLGVCWLLLDLLGCCWMLVVVGCCCCWGWYWKILCFFLPNYSNMRIHSKYLSRLVPNDILKMVGVLNHTHTRLKSTPPKTKHGYPKWWFGNDDFF